MNKSKTLVFFGSGPVAAASLANLIKNFEIEAVVTKPQPAHHKEEPPVITLAKKHKLPLFFASSHDELRKIFDKHKFSSPIGVVVDYGVIIPEQVIAAFTKGIVNSHFSLLPQWRGADPITFSLLSGQKQTGVSLMLIDAGLDTGEIIAQATYDIDADENILSLTKNLVELSNRTINEILPMYLDNKIQPAPQDIEQTPTYSRQLTKSDGMVDWSKKSAQQVEREVRAFLGWPRSSANVYGQKIIIIKARVANGESDGNLVMKCSPGWLEIQQLIGPSGRTMSGADFIRGYRR